MEVAFDCIDRIQGADDDGSGSMSILEAYRALIASGFRPERAVEFHWYSAEVSSALRWFRSGNMQLRFCHIRKGGSSDLKQSPVLMRTRM